MKLLPVRDLKLGDLLIRSGLKNGPKCLLVLSVDFDPVNSYRPGCTLYDLNTQERVIYKPNIIDGWDAEVTQRISL